MLVLCFSAVVAAWPGNRMCSSGAWIDQVTCAISIGFDNLVLMCSVDARIDRT